MDVLVTDSWNLGAPSALTHEHKRTQEPCSREHQAIPLLFQVDSQVSLLKTSQTQGPTPGSFRCQILHPTPYDLGSQKSYNPFLAHHRPSLPSLSAFLN